MTKAEDNFKLYLDERFNGINTLMNAHFITVNERLENIEEQTTKTNGKVVELEKKEISHIVDCPNIIKIQTINDELLEYKIFKKYPKAGIILITIAVILIGVSIWNFKTSIEKEKLLLKPEIEATK